MAQVSQLSPEVARGLLQLARALLVATRNWTLYPPDHPAVGVSVQRLADAIRQSSLGAAFAIGITPETLMVEGAAPTTIDQAIADAAALLHDRDLLQVTFVGEVTTDALHGFLRVLALDPEERREKGGPARIWATEGVSSLVLQQIDYATMLSRERGEVREAARRDDLWRSIVMSIAGGQTSAFDERSQQRLLEIAGSPVDIGDLATAVMAPRCALDGSPMITSQAATVLAAFRHLTSIVSVMAPDRLPAVVGHLATASAQIDPHVVMQVLQSEEDSSQGVTVVGSLASAFDDMKVAQLLATAMALDGQASDRLATIFNTIAPDEDRKRRVLSLTRTMLSETDYGRSGQFQVLWASAEELLISYNDKPFVSEVYRSALDGVGGRAERMAAVDLPPELGDWLETLGQDSVRTLSVTMLIDLLNLARDAQAAEGLASDLEALAEDLLLAGAYADVDTVIGALTERGARAGAIGRDACRHALDHLGESTALRETASLAGDVDEETWRAIRDLMERVGVASLEALKPLLMIEADTIAGDRAADLAGRFGPAAVGRLGALAADDRWYVQRNAARLLGRTRSPDTVPLLQPLLRRGDPRVVREAVSALGNIPDPSAARAIHTVLRAATGPARRAVVEALVADRDPRVVPMLVRIIEESEPLGKDHDVALETIEALGTVGVDEASPVLATVIRRRAFFGRKKLRAVKERGVTALSRIGGPQATAALEDAARTGDRMLRKIVASQRA